MQRPGCIARVTVDHAGCVRCAYGTQPYGQFIVRACGVVPRGNHHVRRPGECPGKRDREVGGAIGRHGHRNTAVLNPGNSISICGNGSRRRNISTGVNVVKISVSASTSGRCSRRIGGKLIVCNSVQLRYCVCHIWLLVSDSDRNILLPEHIQRNRSDSAAAISPSGPRDTA